MKFLGGLFSLLSYGDKVDRIGGAIYAGWLVLRGKVAGGGKKIGG
jgi:hypothetical protein